MTLDLAGHTMTCTGSGFAGACQAATFGTAAGITVVPALAGVRVRGPGLLTGFDDGVEIVGSHARVKGLTITGAVTGASRRIAIASRRWESQSLFVHLASLSGGEKIP